MERKNRLLLSSALCLLLNGCVGLSFDDIFNPNLPQQSTEIRGKTQAQSNQEEKSSALPIRNENVANTVNSGKSIKEAVNCLNQELSKRFNLPDDFHTTKYYSDGSATVQLVNPYTKRQGLFIDVEARTRGSQLRLYANHATMSTAWRTLPEKCR